MTKSIELDVAFENPSDLITLTNDARKYEIELDVVSENADFNGGWPIVKFTGDEDNLILFLDEKGYDREMIQEELSALTS